MVGLQPWTVPTATYKPLAYPATPFGEAKAAATTKTASEAGSLDEPHPDRPVGGRHMDP
jgi:hypothetical protein